MIELDDMEGLQQNNSLEGTNNEGLSEAQRNYMVELAVPQEEWAEMPIEQQTEWMNSVVDRFSELGIDVELGSILEELYGMPALELFESMEVVEHIEAPDDMKQIEMVSDVLADCEELKYENWIHLTDAEKTAVMNDLESRIAAIECRPPCPVRFADMEDNVYGGYRPAYGDITLNDFMLENTPDMYRELVDTLIHEGRHAYQDYNINVAETHPRHSEVDSWRDTWGNGVGKWEYWNDCRTELGQRLYEQQSIEIDARNFAGDVLNAFSQKQSA